MKNRNKWMIGGMLLAALGIGSFFTQQTAVTAAEINIPYTDSNQGFTTGIDGTSLCLNLRNANNCICEDIPQDIYPLRFPFMALEQMPTDCRKTAHRERLILRNWLVLCVLHRMKKFCGFAMGKKMILHREQLPSREMEHIPFVQS